MIEGPRATGPAGLGAPVDPVALEAASRAAGDPARGAEFRALLERESAGRLTFSGHAMKRIEQRGLHLDVERMRRLEQAVDRAEAKGSRDSLILLDELAMVVSVRNHTVVTALDEASRKEHVFTNIDSVVIAD